MRKNMAITDIWFVWKERNSFRGIEKVDSHNILYSKTRKIKRLLWIKILRYAIVYATACLRTFCLHNCIYNYLFNLKWDERNAWIANHTSSASTDINESFRPRFTFWNSSEIWRSVSYFRLVNLRPQLIDLMINRNIWQFCHANRT